MPRCCFNDSHITSCQPSLNIKFAPPKKAPVPVEQRAGRMDAATVWVNPAEMPGMSADIKASRQEYRINGQPKKARKWIDCMPLETRPGLP